MSVEEESCTRAPHCPYSISTLISTKSSTTYLIREKDKFGEYPNIFAKVYYHGPARDVAVVILSDSGTGLNIPSEHPGTTFVVRGSGDFERETRIPTKWNIATFLNMTLNPEHASPYIVLTTHCHYDHICGIQHLLDAKADITVLSSSHNKGYLTPWPILQKHSLCDELGLKAPKYDAQWIDDTQKIKYTSKSSGLVQESSITVIHTPGHTPDSISWFDHETHSLSVGDMFYERESDITRSGSNGSWTKEPPQPVIFTSDSNIIDWNASMHRLLDFVRYENRRLEAEHVSGNLSYSGYRQDGQGMCLDYTETPVSDEGWSLVTTNLARRRVLLCAGHVTVAADAEFALLDMLSFMLRVQLDQVPKKKVQDTHGRDDVWLWDYSLAPPGDKNRSCQYSIRAPWAAIHRHANTIAPQLVPAPVRPQNMDYRSMLRQMTTTSPKSNRLPYLKSNALASVSHSSVMADRLADNTESMVRKE